jgi:hypothetical protein
VKLTLPFRVYHYDNSALNPLKLKNVSDKSRRENKNTNFAPNNFLFRKSCPLLDNVENAVERGRPQMTQYGAEMMQFAYRIAKQEYGHIFKTFNP